MENHRALVSSLLSTGALSSDSGQPETIETHISTVVLTGQFAYKFKKPVNFGFLDFSTLAARKHFCEEELRLNQRLAPRLYLDVVAITGSAKHPQINGDGEPIEYAIRMRQFEQNQLLDKKMAEGSLKPEHIDDIAERIAAFHHEAAVAAPDSHFGRPSSVYAPMEQNFQQLRELITDAGKLDQLARIEKWTREQFNAVAPQLESRGRAGFTRECHGDMHLGNITIMEGEVTIFDGIEFNDEFRWIDVISEIAFITMDLTDRGARPLANRLLNRYLEQTGDYEGLSLLRFYQVYRAMVRAKIASFRLADPALSEQDRESTLQQYQSYANLAESFTRPSAAKLVIMHGVSGSGKSTVSLGLAERLEAIRIRSDVERKRLFDASNNSHDEVGAGLYSEDISFLTYEHLLKRATQLLETGFSVIVDAAFLKHEQRAPFQHLASLLSIPYNVVSLQCPVETLRQRIESRKNDVSDATLNVLEYQLTSNQPPRSDEHALKVNTQDPVDLDKLSQRINA